jgi:hypothetical protein
MRAELEVSYSIGESKCGGGALMKEGKNEEGNKSLPFQTLGSFFLIRFLLVLRLQWRRGRVRSTMCPVPLR